MVAEKRKLGRHEVKTDMTGFQRNDLAVRRVLNFLKHILEEDIGSFFLQSLSILITSNILGQSSSVLCFWVLALLVTHDFSPSCNVS